jgi:hypothetical protein
MRFKKIAITHRILKFIAAIDESSPSPLRPYYFGVIERQKGKPGFRS